MRAYAYAPPTSAAQNREEAPSFAKHEDTPHDDEHLDERPRTMKLVAVTRRCSQRPVYEIAQPNAEGRPP